MLGRVGGAHPTDGGMMVSSIPRRAWLALGGLLVAATIHAQEPATLVADTSRTSGSVRLLIGRIDYVPPLSLDDSARLLAAAVRHLQDAPDKVDPEEVDPSVVRLVESVRDYIVSRDELHTSPGDYEWILVDKGRVSRGSSDRDSFDFPSPITRVSVLGFEAERGDVLIREVVVVDDRGREVTGFRAEPDTPWVVEARFPRRDLFHLWRRTTVSRIDIKYEAAPGDQSKSDPRLHILVGRSETREYGKSAVFSCSQARMALLAGDVARARAMLLDAHRDAFAFREQVRRKPR